MQKWNIGVTTNCHRFVWGWLTNLISEKATYQVPVWTTLTFKNITCKDAGSEHSTQYFETAKNIRCLLSYVSSEPTTFSPVLTKAEKTDQHLLSSLLYQMSTQLTHSQASSSHLSIDSCEAVSRRASRRARCRTESRGPRRVYFYFSSLSDVVPLLLSD